MKNTFLLAIAMVVSGATVSAQTKTLAERLGYKKTDRILIVNNDDCGMCHAANTATIKGMEQGFISTATIMTPCSWYSEIATYAVQHPEKDFGVHLTLTAEWTKHRWTPLLSWTEVPGLYDRQGYMWKGVRDVYAASNPQQALLEGRAQIQKALASGIPITHIDSHMGTYQNDLEYLKIYVQLAEEFNLPLRMASQASMERRGFPNIRKECEEKGLVFPDYFISEEFSDYKNDNVVEFWTNYIKNIKPGVTEIYVHASSESEEIRVLSSTAPKRIKELEFFCSPQLKKLIENEKIIVIGYRPLLELQRKKQ